MLSPILQAGTVNPYSNLNRKLELSGHRVFLAFTDASLPRYPPKTDILERITAPASSSSQAPQESSAMDTSPAREKLKIEVKPMQRPRLVLKFVWMEKNVGLAIEQVIPGGNGSIPLSPYYFWPRKDAWEELKTMLESKPWITKKQALLLLNQATHIINLWQERVET